MTLLYYNLLYFYIKLFYENNKRVEKPTLYIFIHLYVFPQILDARLYNYEKLH